MEPVKIEPDIPTVVLIGATGVGKSYLGNAMLGALEPAKGPFGTRKIDPTKALESVTQASFQYYAHLIVVLKEILMKLFRKTFFSL